MGNLLRWGAPGDVRRALPHRSCASALIALFRKGQGPATALHLVGLAVRGRGLGKVGDLGLGSLVLVDVRDVSPQCREPYHAARKRWRFLGAEAARRTTLQAGPLPHVLFQGGPPSPAWVIGVMHSPMSAIPPFTPFASFSSTGCAGRSFKGMSGLAGVVFIGFPAGIRTSSGSGIEGAALRLLGGLRRESTTTKSKSRSVHDRRG